VVVEKLTKKEPLTPEKPSSVEKVGMEEVRGEALALGFCFPTCLTHVKFAVNTQEMERMTFK
jgi:hypothetical protein